jgi:hypothetical protein
VLPKHRIRMNEDRIFGNVNKGGGVLIFSLFQLNFTGVAFITVMKHEARQSIISEFSSYLTEIAVCTKFFNTMKCRPVSGRRPTYAYIIEKVF